MQDIHPIGARGGGRLFGGGDRRIRPHLHQNPSLKCPRCDSLNTKFCYYNNYNLSQPRHFCKNCRRYWTKGGILRNVPVGGGCRKSKRARPKPSPSSPPDASPPENRGCSSRSSSESSSLTASAATATRPRPRPTTSTPQPSATDTSSASTLLSGFPDSALFLPRAASLSNPNHHDRSFDVEQSSSMMFAGVGSFTSLMTDPAVLSYNVSPPFRFQCQQAQEEEQVVRGQQKLQHQWQLKNKVSVAVGEDVTAATATGILNQTATQVEAQGMPSMAAANTGLLFSAVDWPSGGEQGLFDLPGGIDHGYWGQPQWTDHHDQPLFLP